MFCPKCKAEYREGFTVCTKCDVLLVESLPEKEEPEFVDFVTVFETGNPAIISLARSLLESENVVHYVKGESLQNLFGAGTIGTGHNPIVGSVEFQVDKNDAEYAKELLSQIEESPFTDIDEVQLDENAPLYESKKTSPGFFMGLIIGALITGSIFFIYNWNQKYITDIFEYDLNNDKRPDTFYHYEKGVIVKTNHDRNFDGEIDDWAYYENGAINKSESDDNFDGNIDSWGMYQNDFLVYMEIDVNNDGHPDTVEYYQYGIFSEKEWIRSSSRKIYKKAIFRLGIKREEYIDTDLDGKFDQKTTFNKYEEPVSKANLE